jgi:hypothetical protein
VAQYKGGGLESETLVHPMPAMACEFDLGLLLGLVSVTPLVELRTTNEIPYYTDSNGIVACYEPGLMGRTVYFSVKSDGYEFPEDLLGSRGVSLKVTSGGRAQLKIRRTNIAERLYRITGEGIYRDSVLVGAPVPVKQPLLNGQVMGQDGGLAIPWRAKIYWFWGDTGRPSNSLGNFGTSGATSELPASGGLDPNVGVNLDYFVDDSGFSRPMLPASEFPGPGPKWIGGLKIVSDETGSDRLVADTVAWKTKGKITPRERTIRRQARARSRSPWSRCCASTSCKIRTMKIALGVKV